MDGAKFSLATLCPVALVRNHADPRRGRQAGRGRARLGLGAIPEAASDAPHRAATSTTGRLLLYRCSYV